MIIFQLLAAILLLPLTAVLFIFFNLYFIGGIFFLFIFGFLFFYALLFGLVFLNFSLIGWVLLVLAILYFARMRYLATESSKPMKEENKMNVENRLILDMLQEGKINAEQAEKLLAVQCGEKGQDSAQATKSLNRKFLKVLVIEDNNTKVNINLPIALAEVGLKLIPKDKLKIEGQEINLNEILKLIQEGCMGDLVNIETQESGKLLKVKIFIA